MPARLSSIVGFLVVLEFSAGMLQAWLSPLLPGIVAHYTTTAADLNWISAVYLLSTALCVPILATLGDRYGHRRLLILSVSLVASGSVLVATAPTFGVLLLGRAIEGPLGAFLPLEFAIVRERAGDRAGRAIGLLVGVLVVGAALGSLLAGIARDHLSLSTTLWVPAVVMMACVPLAALLVPDTTVRTAGRVDWAGAVLLGVGLVLLLAAVGRGAVWGWTDPRTVGGVVGGLALLVAWVVYERRTVHPLVDVSLVFRGALSLPLLAGFFYGAQVSGGQLTVALFLGLPVSTGVGLGLTPGQLGLVLLAFGGALFVGTVVAPRLSERFGIRTALLTGALLTAIGYLLTAAAHGSAAGIVLWQVLVGLGEGLVVTALSTQVVTGAAADSVGISTGLFKTSRAIGGAFSAAVFAAVMAAMVSGLPGAGKAVTSESGFVTVWIVCAALALPIAGVATRSAGPTSSPRGARLAAACRRPAGW